MPCKVIFATSKLIEVRLAILIPPSRPTLGVLESGGSLISMHGKGSRRDTVAVKRL